MAIGNALNDGEIVSENLCKALNQTSCWTRLFVEYDHSIRSSQLSSSKKSRLIDRSSKVTARKSMPTVG